MDPVGSSTVGSLEHWASTTPSTAAYVDQVSSLTYEQLADSADRLAAGLVQCGVRAGDHVAVRLRVRSEWFVLYRALGKLGCHQVCMSWRLTPPEAAHIAADSGACVVVCDDEDPGPLVDALGQAGLAAPVIVGSTDVERFGPKFESLLAEATPESRSTPLQTPLVLYTSGTTGAPRGVHTDNRVSTNHEALARYQLALLSRPPIGAHARFLLTLPLHHAAGPAMAAVVQAMGGTVFGLDPYEPERALQMISTHQITHWSAVPTMLIRIKELPDDVLSRYDLSSLHSVAVGAAAVPKSLKTWFIRTFGDILWENYGTSEAGMVSYLAPGNSSKTASSGVPFDEVDVRIVDDDWNARAPGESGEIAVRTPVVVGKYLGERPLESDTLSPDGFLRTGDIGYLDQDGYLFIVDRRKDMIVAGGVNIYPAEVEAALLEHPDVVDVAVVGVPEETFGEQPKAFIELREGADASEYDIISSTSDSLAKYKRPRIVEYVDELPRNHMGKVMKFTLRESEWENRERKI